MEPWQVYFIFMLDNIRAAAIELADIGILAETGNGLVYVGESGEVLDGDH